MKSIILWGALFMSYTSCSQENTTIAKLAKFNGKLTQVQKSYFNGGNLVYRINYANNGWQVLDSIVYEDKNTKHCWHFYKPTYDIENRKLLKYDFSEVECEDKKNAFIQNVEDKYSLSKLYLDDLRFLLEIEGGNKLELDGSTLVTLKESIKPSILTKYGIPFNESLNNFSYKIDNELLVYDQFNFENYVLKREYFYSKNHVLTEVRIYVEGKNLDGEKSYVEQFKSS
jgi:hypothetical protein